MKYNKTDFATRFIGFYIITLLFVWTTKSSIYLLLYGILTAVGLYILQKTKHVDSKYMNPFWFLAGAVIVASPLVSIPTAKMGMFVFSSFFALSLFIDAEKSRI